MKKATMTLLAALVLAPALAQAETFQEVFNQQRALYGKGHEFTFEGKTYKTYHPEEVEAMAEPTKANAEALVASAEAKRQEAAAVGYEWRFTGRILKQAQEALAEERFQDAMNLAAQAKYQARKAVEQQAHVASTWHHAVPE